jgi:hypothetical protein
MKKFLILSLLLISSIITAQTITIYTNNEEKHYISSSSIGYDIPIYNTFVFTNDLVTVISEGVVTSLSVENIESDIKNKQIIYTCRKTDGTLVIFFVRKYFIAIDFNQPGVLYIYRIYNRS